MTKTYNSEEAARSYDKARLMPGDSMAQWMNLLSASVPADDVKRILDLGAGTGRFSFALAGRYQCPVLAVDPSEPMLHEGQEATQAGQDITWRVGSAEDFLGLSPEEAALVEIRLRLARCVRELRLEQRLTQEKLAKRIGSSQSRVAKMERADSSVSLDLMVRSIVALGKSPEEVGRVISSKAA